MRHSCTISFGLQVFRHHALDRQSFVLQNPDVVQISKNCVVKKVGDLGKPGTPGHFVELEVKVPRRTAIRMVLPYLVALMFVKVASE